MSLKIYMGQVFNYDSGWCTIIARQGLWDQGVTKAAQNDAFFIKEMMKALYDNFANFRKVLTGSS